MLLLLILFSLVFLSLTLSGEAANKKNTAPLASGFILALIVFSAFVFISTELLSLFDLLIQRVLVVLWSAALSFSFIAWLRRGRYFPVIRLKFGFSVIEKILFGSIAVIFIVTCITAVTAYPNNWDSMTYHLSRVMFWIQHKNINYFPTQIDRQVTQPPLAEYIILHFRLLCSDDKFANLVQWLFMCGSAVCVSLITKETGGNRKTQLLASFFCAVIPMGILQSTSTQNDYVESFFIATALLFLLRCIKNKKELRVYITFILCCLLAADTKGTAYIFLPPLILIFSVVAIVNMRWAVIKIIPFAILLLAIFWLPQAARNYSVYHLTPGPDYGLENTSFGVAPTLSNMSKNIAMHLKTPLPAVNHAIENAVVGFDHAIGIDTYSPAYNWVSSPKFTVSFFSVQEDAAGNFFHVILFFFCLVIFFFRKDLRSNKLLWIVLGSCVVMFILFCTFLKWQIWHCRLHLPMFVAIAPFFAMVISTPNKKFMEIALIAVFFIFGCVFLFFNESRPIFARQNIFNSLPYDQYFKNNKDLENTFFDLSGAMWRDDIRKVGWVTGGDTWEYPMWPLMRDMPNFKMENIMVTNATNQFADKKPFSEFNPDAIIVNRFEPDSTKSLEYKDRLYHLVYQYKTWTMYER